MSPNAGELGLSHCFWRTIKTPAVLAIIFMGVMVACLIVVRAVHQDVTIDEATTYLKFAGPSSPNPYWQPHANNHLLNSILARVSTGWFGLSEFTLRLPNVLAGLAYIALAAFLAELLFGRTLLAVLLFGLLVLNPFVLEFFSAARGYGLALTAQTGALLMIAEDVVAGRRKPYLVSVLCGLMVCANLAFAVNAAVTLAVYFLWLHPPTTLSRETWRAAGADALRLGLPFVLLVAVVVGPTILGMPHSQLIHGTYSPTKTFESVMRHVFPAPDGLLLPSSLAPAISDLNRVGYWLVAALLALSPLLLFGAERTARDKFAVLCGAILLTTCAGHLALLTFDVKLPLGRTALFFVPLATVIVATVAARLEFAGMAMLALLVISFSAAVRISYIDQWRSDAGIRGAVIAAGDYARANNLTVVGTTSKEAWTSDFYRRLLGYKFKQPKPAEDPDLNISVHIVVDRRKQYAEPLKSAGFKVIYENDISGMRVYARPIVTVPASIPSKEVGH
jgi:hypothetical protein